MNLKQLRQFEGMHAETLAKRLGTRPSMVLNRESAPLRNLPLGDIITHCEGMGLKLQLVITRADGSKDSLE